ncbi:hypothetical protein B4102_2157 [Heyndrickxia sporothermodurans]|uniref:ParB/Sulfiredoxin domain-containing protein n=1 Tax=Heyndrickxia sporothermodurans TaxID=46224 RepID=A0A150LHE1_9BACI|nr:hypothetical protein [Heyndrickxia sporothermodurans]KYD11429.1 hypothetical protein B4102_2157 [Heyndrickxia sporothermodurans]
MFNHDCGHVSFSDGQHRTCIAKKIGVNSLVVSSFKTNQGYDCRVCYLKNEYNQLSFIQKVWKRMKTDKREDAIQKEFIDDDLSGSFLKGNNMKRN